MAGQRFSRLEPQQSADLRRRTTSGSASGSQKAIEWGLFALLGLLLIGGALALWATFSPSWKEVPSTVAEGFDRDRVNILLIGVGGDEHPQGYDGLADTIIMASLRPSTGDVALISIPRDLYVQIGTYGRHRLNRAHAIGAETGYPGKGAGLLVDTVEQITAQPIDGFVRVDFKAFETIVDAVGGVEVNVPESFHDDLFNDGFEAGHQTLNGDRALRYARYRYGADGREADNFARERRQRQLLEALRAKLSGLGPGDIAKLMKSMPKLSHYTATNLSSTEVLRLYRAADRAQTGDLQTVSLEPWVQDIYIRRVFDGGEAVAPRTGRYDEIQHAVRDVFSEVPRGTTESLRTAASEPVRHQRHES